MSDREPVTPTADVPLSVAAEELTGFEVLAIERRFGASLEALGGVSVLVGAVWALENRDGAKVSWAAVEARTLRELNGYFPPEPDNAEEEDPGTHLGKDSPNGATRTPRSRAGVSVPGLDLRSTSA